MRCRAIDDGSWREAGVLTRMLEGSAGSCSEPHTATVDATDLKARRTASGPRLEERLPSACLAASKAVWNTRGTCIANANRRPSSCPMQASRFGDYGDVAPLLDDLPGAR